MTEPIACTLTADELRARQNELLPSLVRRAVSVQFEGDELELRFTPAPGLLADIAKVVEAERQCCRFLAFDLHVDSSSGPIALRVSGPPGTRPVLEQLLEVT